MKFYIKNMVCNRCKWAVKAELEKLGHQVLMVNLGEVELKDAPTAEQLDEINRALHELGFEWINDKSSQLIESIKAIMISLVEEPEELERYNLSDILANRLHKDYSSLSKLFSEVEGVTIEQYFILLKVEKVKELLVYDEKSLTQIAFDLGYSSVAHLSNQFKKVTGLTPSHFKQLREKPRKTLDNIH
ncbi:AraC family transcriptional regulator [Flavihumibacter rivuli]|uniref:helix-turn-helix domain-containing protein n=1 Tax=Flavihumibacter rivuli TaxID=2838156 RepID=UPI001BDE169E|nr:AraC family transcriptional regulator [Flavihumibacter rivuli]ULQ55184.1 AraC family transcriptional regulator [Flavihumibacter rivuli]